MDIALYARSSNHNRVITQEDWKGWVILYNVLYSLTFTSSDYCLENVRVIVNSRPQHDFRFPNVRDALVVTSLLLQQLHPLSLTARLTSAARSRRRGSTEWWVEHVILPPACQRVTYIKPTERAKRKCVGMDIGL